MKRLLLLLLVFFGLVGVYLAHSTLQPNNKPIDTKERVTNKMSTASSFLQSMLPGTPTSNQMVWPSSPIISNPTPAPSTATGSHDLPYGPNGETYYNDGSYAGIYNGTDPDPKPPVWTDPTGRGLNRSQYNNLVSGFNTQKSNIYGSANDAASALQGGYGQSIQDTIHNLTLGQQGIDRQGVQNEASKISSGRSILDMVGRGIRSGGVMLANKNAGNSSAAGAIANAYGQLGRQQLSSVGSQYAQNASNIDTAQQEQNYQVAQAPQKFHVDLMNNVNNIVNTARDKFAQLDAAMANASLPDRIAIDQERENVRAQVLGQLQQYDAQLAQGVGGIHAASQQDNRAKANQQILAGQADPNMFNFTTQAPMRVQGSAPAGGNLPLFTLPRNRTQIA